jgi:hemoglobin
MDGPDIFEALGGAPGCRALAEAFYARVARDPVLRPLFPAHFRCAIEEFSAFLVQFLGGPPEHSQRRWWLSLRESHARFPIGPRERDAWIVLMNATLDEFPAAEPARQALKALFDRSSAYLIGRENSASNGLTDRWNEQLAADQAISAIARGDAASAIELTPKCSRTILPGLLARMIRTRHPQLLDFAEHEIRRDPDLTRDRYASHTLLHAAAAAGCDRAVRTLLNAGADPNATDGGGHTPLYSVANECQGPGGADVVRTLVGHGASIDAAGGVQRCTALHMAARRGNLEVAKALLDSGANIDAQDKRGETPLKRALNCRKTKLAEFLIANGARAVGLLRPARS